MMNTTRKLYSIKEALEAVPGISKNGLYLQVRKGTIPSVKIGGRVFIPASYIDGLDSQENNKVLCKGDEQMQENVQTKKVLAVGEVDGLFCVSRQTIKNMANSCVLPVIRLGRRMVFPSIAIGEILPNGL